MMLSRVSRTLPARHMLRTFSSETPTSTSYEKMASDSRYKSDLNIEIDPNFEGDKFSIKGREVKNVRPSYLDMQATTPLDPRVLDKMLPHMMGSYGKPHSRTHSYGWDSEKSVEEARKQVSEVVVEAKRSELCDCGAVY